jgi:hypothetical protein
MLEAGRGERPEVGAFSYPSAGSFGKPVDEKKTRMPAMILGELNKYGANNLKKLVK